MDEELEDILVAAILEEHLKTWPMCAKDGCKNRACLRLNSRYCYPHTQFSFNLAFSSVAEKCGVDGTQPPTPAGVPETQLDQEPMTHV